MADRVVNLADRRPAPPDLAMIDGYVCKTYGEQFGSLSYQLENGEHRQVLDLLRRLADLYADEPMPDKEGDCG